MKLSQAEARALHYIPVELRERFFNANKRLRRENSLGALEEFRSVVRAVAEKRKK